MERQAVTKNQNAPVRQGHVQRNAAGNGPARLVGLQSAIGNQAMRRLIDSPFIQAKLEVSQPGDPFEEEADRVADTVMRMPEQSVSPQPQSVSGQITRMVQRSVPVAVREDDDDEEKVATKIDEVETGCCDTPVLRRSSDEEPEEEVEGPPVQRQTEEEEEEEDVQAKLWSVQRACKDCEDEMVHRDHSGEHASANSASLASNVHALNGRGSPLPPDTRAFFEPRFGADFSNVRIHTDSHAADTAKSINARAFTVGSNIAFGSGQFDPGSQQGKQILAHELTHVVQQGAATSTHQVQRTPEMIQTCPQPAAKIPPVTDKQARWHDHAEDVVDIQNKATFKPNDGLGNYISSLWESGQYNAPVNINFGSLGCGYIFVNPTGRYLVRDCLNIPVGLFGPTIRICDDVPPESQNYNAELQTIPLELDSFKTDKGCVVLLVGIMNGFIFGNLAWVEGKKPDEIYPDTPDAAVLFNEEAFLPLIYGDQYDGQNYTPIKFINELDNGIISFLSAGDLELANQQTLQGTLGIVNSIDMWLGDLKGKAKGLEDYTLPIERSPEADLYGETVELSLDKEWTGGDPNSEDGAFTVQGSLRASYRNGTFDFFGSASYASKRVQGEVNIAITTESEAQQLFAEHAPAEKKEGAAAPVVLTPGEDGTKEPLALTGWGNLKFKLIDKSTPAPAAAGGAAAGKKAMPEDLEGEGAFVVSSDGYIVMSGKLKLPTNWQFTDKLKYTSADPDADTKLFEKRISTARAPVPFGTVGLDIEIGVDAEAQLDPLELYEIEISGVYSNHPDYRSEVGITPRFYISGYASATVTAKLIAAYKLFGVFTVGEFSGSLIGTARADAYIDAAPTVSMVWPDKDSPASYAIAGKIHAGGKLTFSLTGNLSVSVLKKKIAKTEDYHIGTWTLGSFGIALILQEYIIGSGATPKFDYSKIGFDEKQRKSLGTAIGKEKEATGAPDKRTGGFTQTEEGKEVEKGTFSTTEPTRPDAGAETIDNVLEEDFVMQDKLHELSLTFSGTRDNPQAVIEMASGEKEPLDEKILAEEFKVVVAKDFSTDEEKEQLEQRQNDLKAIDKEAKAVKKSAEQAAQKVEAGEEPVVAGFDRLDDRISSYGQKHGVDDLGVILPTTQPATIPAAAPALRIPKSTGANLEMERRLKEKREQVGYASFADFQGSNVAVFRYNVLKPGSTAITKASIVEGPLYEASVNTSNKLHSEIIILGMLQKIQASPEFRAKHGPGYIISVDQVLSERSPCFQCQSSLRQRSSLIWTSNYHNFYLVHYSGDWIKRNRALMLKYGLTPPSIDDLRKQYGRAAVQEPH